MSTAIIDAKLYASFFLISLDEKPEVIAVKLKETAVKRDLKSASKIR